MAYVIKRYANRKLYDTRTKRYLTLDEVGVLVRAGEDIHVEDADTGNDLTATVLAKIIAEGNKKGNALMPTTALVDLIQRPGEVVLDAVKSSVNAGQRAAGQVGHEIGKFVDSMNRRVERDAVKPIVDAGEAIARVVEERLRALLAEMHVATKADVDALKARIATLEARPVRAKAASKNGSGRKASPAPHRGAGTARKARPARAGKAT